MKPKFQGSTGRAFLAGAIIVVAAVAAYRHSFRVPFVYDDDGSITNNPSIRSLWPIWSVLKPLPGGMPVSGRPILNLSFALNYAISGLNVWSYHVFNLAVHILAGLTLFGILKWTLLRWSALSQTRLSDGAEQRVGDNALHPNTSIAFIIALIWTVHPLQTEAVVYVSQRAESLMGLFYLLTLYFFIRGADADLKVGRIAPNTPGALRKTEASSSTPPNRAYWGQSAPPRNWFLALSILFCLLGMATKEVMISAPLIVLLYDRTFVAGTFREAWKLRKRYYLGLASTWLVLIWLVLGTGSRGGTAGFGLAVAPWSYALIQFQAIVHYLRLAIWPHPLVFYYGRPVAAIGAIAIDAAIVVLLVGWSALSLTRCWTPPGASALGTMRSTSSYSGQVTGFSGAAFFLILAPSSSIVPVGTEMIAEHRMYLSLAAVVAVAVGGIWFFVGRLLAARSVYFCVFLFLAVAGGLALTTDRRIDDYRSDLALWTDTAAKMPNNSTIRANLGSALLQAGNAPAAMLQCREAVRLNPDNARAQSGLADALVQTDRRAEAIEHYQSALRINPGLFEARNNLGIALAQSGLLPEATAQFQEAVRLKPDVFEAHNNLAMVLAKAGRLPEAGMEFEAALRLKPDDAGARVHLERVRALQQNR